MHRRYFDHQGLRLSYLDAQGPGRPIVALHAHWMDAEGFEPVATALSPDLRVIALDQRGHGRSSHAASYTRDDYVGDLHAFVEHLGIERPVWLGNSLGGVNAYQFAARYPGPRRRAHRRGHRRRDFREPDEMLESQRHVNGSHWADWLASDCPALVLRGSTSRVTTRAALEEMAARRPRTRFVELEGGHALHVDNPDAVAAEVRAFLAVDGHRPAARLP